METLRDGAIREVPGQCGHIFKRDYGTPTSVSVSLSFCLSLPAPSLFLPLLPAIPALLTFLHRHDANDVAV